MEGREAERQLDVMIHRATLWDRIVSWDPAAPPEDASGQLSTAQELETTFATPGRAAVRALALDLFEAGPAVDVARWREQARSLASSVVGSQEHVPGPVGPVPFEVLHVVDPVQPVRLPNSLSVVTVPDLADAERALSANATIQAIIIDATRSDRAAVQAHLGEMAVELPAVVVHAGVVATVEGEYCLPQEADLLVSRLRTDYESRSGAPWLESHARFLTEAIVADAAGVLTASGTGGVR